MSFCSCLGRVVLKIFLFIFLLCLFNEHKRFTSPNTRLTTLKHYFDTTEKNAEIKLRYEWKRVYDPLVAMEGHAEKQYRKINQLQYEIKQLESRLENLE